ncbi:Uncharacterised protein [Streptococcus agalactiae]|uniref:Uncharacterized protein n=1 Tax=Streptococcus agalactiae TaxID=1311 RepID=A0A7Z7KBP4_STRAG|nr:Uncharacterised protein [Streptococcus agalactiae]SUN10966.1 Uncharacterised protein [Streptococcus agalactiae]SUN18968.1 Uncharacterised protein [Streptococcus agalactiae]SUN18977.1 Uncharacterised protein [Streptococcus agalactiae]
MKNEGSKKSLPKKIGWFIILIIVGILGGVGGKLHE